MDDKLLLTLTADIAAAYLSHNSVDADAVGGVVSAIAGGLQAAVNPPEPVEEFSPAVDPRKSVKPDAIISLIDGKPYKMLKRHLALNGLTPEQYRDRYGLAPDYPMVARNYSERRRELAKSIGLGRHDNAGRGRKKAA